MLSDWSVQLVDGRCGDAELGCTPVAPRKGCESEALSDWVALLPVGSLGSTRGGDGIAAELDGSEFSTDCNGVGDGADEGGEMTAAAAFSAAETRSSHIMPATPTRTDTAIAPASNARARPFVVPESSGADDGATPPVTAPSIVTTMARSRPLADAS
jgi:hypothetical protein